jgi:SNF2 family DNA or RNA helicase
VIVPASTLENWRREFNTWCPQAKLLVYTGQKASRQIAHKLEFSFDLPDGLTVPKFNVMLTSYEIFRQDLKVFLDTFWQLLVLDEGQRIKDSKSQTFKKTMAVNCHQRILLSGTPMNNNFDELFNLMEWLSPQKFDARFRKEMDQLRTQNLDANQTGVRDQGTF